MVLQSNSHGCGCEQYSLQPVGMACGLHRHTEVYSRWHLVRQSQSSSTRLNVLIMLELLLVIAIMISFVISSVHHLTCPLQRAHPFYHRLECFCLLLAGIQ